MNITQYINKYADDKLTVLDVAGGLAGAATLKGSALRTVGLHKVYHGTNADKRVDIIKNKGLDPRKGGTGAGRVASRFAKESAGKIHVTKFPGLAKVFTSRYPTGRGQPDSDKKVYPTNKKRVISAYLSDDQWRHLKADKHMSPIPFKSLASTGTRKIPSYRMVGGKGYKFNKVLKQSVGNIGKYIRKSPTRFGIGVAGTALGLAGIGNLAHDTYGAAKRK